MKTRLIISVVVLSVVSANAQQLNHLAVATSNLTGCSRAAILTKLSKNVPIYPFATLKNTNIYISPFRVHGIQHKAVNTTFDFGTKNPGRRGIGGVVSKVLGRVLLMANNKLAKPGSASTCLMTLTEEEKAAGGAVILSIAGSIIRSAVKSMAHVTAAHRDPDISARQVQLQRIEYNVTFH